jgi:uncharacterized OB-fold protein
VQAAEAIGPEGSGVRAAGKLYGHASVRIIATATSHVGPTQTYLADGKALNEARSEGAYLPRATYLENLPSRWRFSADRCARCGATTFPRRARCRRCGAVEGLSSFELPRQGGTVEALTTVHAGAQPTEFDWSMTPDGSYDVALVRVHPEARVTLQVTEATPGTLRSGGRVDTVLRRLYPFEGEWRYGRKAVPAGFRASWTTE